MKMTSEDIKQSIRNDRSKKAIFSEELTLNQDSLFVALQHMLPQHGLSRLLGYVANCQWPVCKTPLIRLFARYYQVDMAEAASPSLEDYACFNDFFTRALRADARPIAAAPDHLVCPVDGAISQFGRITEGRIIQAKGLTYSVQELLTDDGLAKHFEHGQFATVYLSPKDYHRIHMPLAGTLTDMIYVPGRLFSVNQATAQHVPRLFARNERVVTVFDTPHGKMALVLVGAMIVAGIETVWAGHVAPNSRRVQHTNYSKSDTVGLHKGDEMGRFKLGSTVVVLCANPALQWQDHVAANAVVQMGQSMAKF